MPKRRRKPGRPRTGHDPMVGVRLPRKMLRKIARVADALGADQSTAIRSILERGLDSGMMIGLLQSGKGRGRTGGVAMAVMAQFKAGKAAEHATRAAPAGRTQAEIKALRAAEDADERLSRIGDRLALEQAQSAESKKSGISFIEPKPPLRHLSRSRSPRSFLFEKRTRGRYKKEN